MESKPHRLSHWGRRWVCLPSAVVTAHQHSYLTELRASRAQSRGFPKEPCVSCSGVRVQAQPLANVSAFVEGATSFFHWFWTFPTLYQPCSIREAGWSGHLIHNAPGPHTHHQLLLPLPIRRGLCLLLGRGSAVQQHLNTLLHRQYPAPGSARKPLGHAHSEHQAVGVDKHRVALPVHPLTF